MDPSTSTAQDAQNQQASDQPTQPVQQIQPVQPSQQPKTQVSVGNIESGAATIVQEASDADADEDDEDELKVAPQETKNQVVSRGGFADIQEESVEVQPSVPEVVTGSPEVEKVIEKSPDQEKPELSKEVKAAGVTHSGPGVIEVEQNNFGVKKMPPITFAQAVDEEKKTKLHDSKHWYMAMITYIWRKLNPKVGETNSFDEKKATVPGDQTPALPVEKIEEIEQNGEAPKEVPSQL